MQDIKLVEEIHAPWKISFETNGEVMDWMTRHTSHIAPDRDHDQRYKDLYLAVNRAGLKFYLKRVDWSDTEQFANSGQILKILQPRGKSLDNREPEIQATMGTLYDENGNLMLDRPPILTDLPDGKLGKVTGWKRSECLRRKDESCWALVIEGASTTQIAKLARIGNKQTKDDIEEQSEEDHIVQYTTAAELWMDDEEVKKEDIFEGSSAEASLREFLKETIREEQYKYQTDTSRLGVIVNKIVDMVGDDSRYWKPPELSLKATVELDKCINKELQKFIPHSIWDTSRNDEKDRGVYQFFSSAETIANTKQKLDTLLESNDRVYSGDQSLHMVEWIKYKQGKALAETVAKSLATRLEYWTKINNDPRRVKDYKIKPIERLFFPASFVEMKSRLFEWDKETRSFIEKLAVA